jgi:hypothetical protein
MGLMRPNSYEFIAKYASECKIAVNRCSDIPKFGKKWYYKAKAVSNL